MLKEIILFTLLASMTYSAELLTNCAHFNDAPKWVHLSRVNRIAENVTRFMEWDIRRVEVIWYQNQKNSFPHPWKQLNINNLQVMRRLLLLQQKQQFLFQRLT